MENCGKYFVKNFFCTIFYAESEIVQEIILKIMQKITVKIWTCLFCFKNRPMCLFLINNRVIRSYL